MNLNLSKNKISKADLFLFIMVSLYFLMNGAQLFETFVVVPAWTETPPQSLSILRKPYELDLKNFWIFTHSVHEIFMLLAIIFNWKFLARRKVMVTLFLLHIAVRAWTIGYFAPNIIDFQTNEIEVLRNAEITQRTIEWKNYNYLRVAIFFLINLGYAFLLKKPVK